MKKIYIAFLLAGASLMASAQATFDVLKLSETELSGTSRYMSMSTYDNHYYALDSMKITIGMVDDLRLTTLMLGNRVRLEGEDPNTIALNDLIESAESSGKQFKLELRSNEIPCSILGFTG